MRLVTRWSLLVVAWCPKYVQRVTTNVDADLLGVVGTYKSLGEDGIYRVVARQFLIHLGTQRLFCSLILALSL